MSDIVIYIPDDEDPTDEQLRMLPILQALADTDVDEVYRAVWALIPHTVRGQTSTTGWPYGTPHDYDCPACVASGTSFTASPRSETYWSS